jgi:hypothetical protein
LPKVTAASYVETFIRGGNGTAEPKGGSPVAHAQQTANRSPALPIAIALVALVLFWAIIAGLGTTGNVRVTTDANGTVQYVGPQTVHVPANPSALPGVPGYNPNG